MKTTMMAGVCLLALVLTFTIAECGPSQEKRQESPTQTPLCQECVRECEYIGQSPNECAEICDCYDVKGGGAPGDDGNGSNYDNVPDEDNGLDEDNGSDDNNGSDSGAAVGGGSIQDSGPGGAHAGDGPDYDNGSDDGNAPNDGNGFDDGDGPSDGPSDGNGSNDNNGSDDGNASGSGAAVAVAGATIFTIISAVLVAVASAMN